MSRTTSSAFKAAAFGQETDDVIICLLTITHESMVDPIRLSSDPTERISDNPVAYATASRGNTYVFLPFDFTLPDDRNDVPPRVSINISNTTRDLIALVRSITSPLQIKMELVLASSPDTVEVEVSAMQMGQITYDANNLNIDLIVDAQQSEPFPADGFTRSRFPGLF